MATRSLAREEKFALPLAVVFHVALVVALLWKPVGDAIVQPPERISVTFTDEVALSSTAPDPVAEAAPPAAGVAVEELPPIPTSEPIAQPRDDTPPPPRPQTTPQPRAAPQPQTRAEAPPRPRREPVVRPTARPQPTPARQPSPRRSEPARSSPPKAAEPKGQIDGNFLGGSGASKASDSTGTPAEAIGPRVLSSLAASISRQLKPHWSAPQGADAEQLVTILAFDLNRDGSLNGSPRLVEQKGVNDANRAQAGRHVEQAIRAVRLAAPFNLPEEYYDAWKRVSDFRFDRRL